MGWVRSKPVYVDLAVVPGAGRHLFASMGERGARAVRRALPESPENLTHLHTGDGAPPEAIVLRSAAFLLARLEAELKSSPASTALYLAGPEQFIWRAFRIGRDCGLSLDRILAELAGSAARTVYCVHCKAFTANVVTNIVPCSGCGHTLFVRDHFSRRLVAYAGVRVDAEVPGELPEQEVLYA